MRTDCRRDCQCECQTDARQCHTTGRMAPCWWEWNRHYTSHRKGKRRSLTRVDWRWHAMSVRGWHPGCSWPADTRSHCNNNVNNTTHGMLQCSRHARVSAARDHPSVAGAFELRLAVFIEPPTFSRCSACHYALLWLRPHLLTRRSLRTSGQLGAN